MNAGTKELNRRLEILEYIACLTEEDRQDLLEEAEEIRQEISPIVKGLPKEFETKIESVHFKKQPRPEYSFFGSGTIFEYYNIEVKLNDGRVILYKGANEPVWKNT